MIIQSEPVIFDYSDKGWYDQFLSEAVFSSYDGYNIKIYLSNSHIGLSSLNLLYSPSFRLIKSEETH